MNADDTDTITTARLLLRRFCRDDAEPLHAIFAAPEAMRFWSTLPHATLAETADFVARTMAAQEAGTADEFVVLREGAIVGKAGLWRANELGFIFAPSVWGRGVASEALRALMARAAQRGFIVLRADVDPRNARSLRLLRRLGFQEVGAASRTLCVGGEWVDSVYLEATLARP